MIFCGVVFTTPQSRIDTLENMPICGKCVGELYLNRRIRALRDEVVAR